MDKKNLRVTIMDNKFLILGLIVIPLTATVYAASTSRPTSGEITSTSVAWYTANISEARSKNKECFDNPEMQSAPECINSQHALEISYKGSNT